MTAPCLWTYDETHDKYDTACGQAWQLTTGTPAENGMQFCPYCGRTLLGGTLDVEEIDEEDDDDDE